MIPLTKGRGAYREATAILAVAPRPYSQANHCTGDRCDGCQQPRPHLYRYEAPGLIHAAVKRLCIPCLAIANRLGWDVVQQARTRHRAPQEPRRRGKGKQPQYGSRGPRYPREKKP